MNAPRLLVLILVIACANSRDPSSSSTDAADSRPDAPELSARLRYTYCPPAAGGRAVSTWRIFVGALDDQDGWPELVVASGGDQLLGTLWIFSGADPREHPLGFPGLPRPDFELPIHGFFSQVRPAPLRPGNRAEVLLSSYHGPAYWYPSPSEPALHAITVDLDRRDEPVVEHAALLPGCRINDFDLGRGDEATRLVAVATNGCAAVGPTPAKPPPAEPARLQLRFGPLADTAMDRPAGFELHRLFRSTDVDHPAHLEGMGFIHADAISGARVRLFDLDGDGVLDVVGTFDAHSVLVAYGGDALSAALARGGTVTCEGLRLAHRGPIQCAGLDGQMGTDIDAAWLRDRDGVLSPHVFVTATDYPTHTGRQGPPRLVVHDVGAGTREAITLRSEPDVATSLRLVAHDSHGERRASVSAIVGLAEYLSSSSVRRASLVEVGLDNGTIRPLTRPGAQPRIPLDIASRHDARAPGHAGTHVGPAAPLTVLPGPGPKSIDDVELLDLGDRARRVPSCSSAPTPTTCWRFSQHLQALELSGPASARAELRVDYRIHPAPPLVVADAMPHGGTPVLLPGAAADCSLRARPQNDNH